MENAGARFTKYLKIYHPIMPDATVLQQDI